MKNFALTLALLSAAVLSPAATPSPAHAADTLPAPAALSPAHAAGTLPIASAPDAPAVPPAAFSAGSSAAQTPRGMTAPAPEQNLLDDKIYFFAHAMCIACKDAFVYLDANHRDLNIPITDMKFHHNLELYKQCVKKFNIPNSDLRLPLICMGNHYIMGWEPEDGARFEEYLQKFRQETAAAGHAAISAAVDEAVPGPAPELKEPLAVPAPAAFPAPAASAPAAAPTAAAEETSGGIAASLEALKGSEPIEPTAIVRDE